MAVWHVIINASIDEWRARRMTRIMQTCW